MASTDSRRAALRRSKLPGVLPPAELAELPALPQSLRAYGWRNPINAVDYDRDQWEIYYVEPSGSVTVAHLRRVSGDQFRLWRGGRVEAQGFDVAGAADAFAVAVAMLKD